VAANSLRLIHSGRLLTDGILLLPWLRSLEDRHRRQAKGVSGDVDDVLRDVGLADQDERDDAGAGSSAEDKIWLHCVVGAAAPPSGGETPSLPVDQVSADCGTFR
jgi:hypothetical protein